MTKSVVQFGLCLLVAVFSGGILLLGVPLKWEIAFMAALGTSVSMLVTGSPKRVLLFVVSVTVPIYFGKALVVSRGNGSVANGAGINLTDVLALALLLLLLAKLAIRQIEIHFFPLTTIPALAWLVLSSLSLLTARDGQLGLIQLMNMSKLLLFCWVIANSVRNEVDVTWVTTGVVLGVLFQALVGIYQGVTGHPLGLYFLTETSAVQQQQLTEGLVYRVQGTIGHPNSYAMYVTTGLPLALAFLFSAPRTQWKYPAIAALCLGCLALVFSLSRSAWVNSVVITSLVLALAVRRKRIGGRAAVLIAGTTSLVLLGLILLGPHIIRSRLTSSDLGSANSRITQAQTALAMIKGHPWVGVGLNNYVLVSPHYGAADFVSDKPVVVHNAFLLIAAETGLVGLTAFLSLLAILLIQAWRIVNRARTDTLWVAGVGVLSAFVALSVHSMVDYALLGSLQTITQFWLLAGLCAALIQHIDHDRQDARRVL